jgi:hypothetical protein
VVSKEPCPGLSRRVRIPDAGVVGIRVERKPSADVATLVRSAKKKDYFAARV